MAEPDLVTRRGAIDILERGRVAIAGLLGRVPAAELDHPGVGGGEWSPKDLVGHLASWEERALEALAAWGRGEPAPIDREFRSRTLTAINAEAVAAKAGLSYAEVRREARRTHAELLRAIEAIPDGRWGSPATPRGRRPLGHRLGQILVGTGPFAHAQAHVESLRAFVDRFDS
ncbi:MAG TPA: DinB family protein [Actinomycetota bacterium]|jgi:hypothetical protein|nr:DinB family protein [Actinomycetota bacterium]